MHVSKFKISAAATGKLRVASNRSGLTPNLLCRLAMTTSFEAGPLQQVRTDLKEGQEFRQLSVRIKSPADVAELLSGE